MILPFSDIRSNIGLIGNGPQGIHNSLVHPDHGNLFHLTQMKKVLRLAAKLVQMEGGLVSYSTAKGFSFVSKRKFAPRLQTADRQKSIHSPALWEGKFPVKMVEIGKRRGGLRHLLPFAIMSEYYILTLSPLKSQPYSRILFGLLGAQRFNMTIHRIPQLGPSCGMKLHHTLEIRLLRRTHHIPVCTLNPAMKPLGTRGLYIWQNI